MISILSPEVRMDEMAAIVPINGRGFQIGEGGKRRRKRKEHYDVTLSECWLSHPRPFNGGIDIEVGRCELV